MTRDRRKLRGVVLSEDKRTERFFRALLKHLGFDVRRFRFESAPSGEGAAEAWVAERYPGEVRVLRSKSYQRDLGLVVARDGNSVGVGRRKQELDQSLRAADLEARGDDERIAIPVPTRNIETWLLELLGARNLEEAEDYKFRFEHEHGSRETSALRRAAEAWRDTVDGALPSLRDGVVEMGRIEP